MLVILRLTKAWLDYSPISTPPTIDLAAGSRRTAGARSHCILPTSFKRALLAAFLPDLSPADSHSRGGLLKIFFSLSKRAKLKSPRPSPTDSDSVSEDLFHPSEKKDFDSSVYPELARCTTSDNFTDHVSQLWSYHFKSMWSILLGLAIVLNMECWFGGG